MNEPPSRLLRASLVAALLLMGGHALAYTDGDWSFSYSGDTATITGYSGSSSAVSVPSTVSRTEEYQEQDDEGEWHTRHRTYTYTVTAIGSGLFKNKSSLTGVTIPSSVTSIGSELFYGCTSLQAVTASGSIKTIPSSCFYGCSSLTSFSMPASVTSIESSAFYGCRNWSPPGSFSSSLASIGSEAFRDCVKFLSVTLGPNITTLGESAFYGCDQLTDVTVDSPIALPNTLFANCSNIVSVVIGDHVKGLGNVISGYYLGFWSLSHPFKGCPKIESFVVGRGVESIPNYYFSGYDSSDFPSRTSLTQIDLPDTITTIGYSAFYGCRNADFGQLSLPNLKSIEDYAFDGCLNAGFGQLSLPSLKSIGNYAFSGCRLLESFDFPASLTSIGMNAFEGCVKFRTVVLGPNVKTLGTRAFYGCDQITSVTVDSPVTLPDLLFWNCSNIVSVVIGDNVKGLGSTGNSHPFYQCPKIKTFHVGSGITEIPPSYFSGRSSLTSISIPSSVTTIGSDAFYGCRNADLGQLSLPHLKSIGSYAFSGCRLLEPFAFPDSLTSIGDSAFQDCVKFRTVTLGPNLKTLGTYAFYGCDQITSVTVDNLPASVKSIGSYAFENCSLLANVRLEGVPPTTGSYVFKNVATGARGHYSYRYADEWSRVIDANGKWNGLVMVEIPPRRIENVRARPVPGTQKVRVFYDLNANDGGKYDVGISLGSGEEGGSVPAATTFTGDMGADVLPGRNKVVEWDAGADVTETVLSNAVAQVEATRPDETLEGESDEFGVDTRGGWEIENVWCEFCEGAYGTAYGKHATFLEGVSLPVSFFVELKNRRAPRSFLVNGQAAPFPSPGFVLDVGGLRAGGKMEVAAVCVDDYGREIKTKPFRVNLDIAPVPEGAGEMFALDTASGRVLYAGETFATIPVFEDVDDTLDFFGTKIPFKLWPSVSISKSFDSSSGRYKQNKDAGLRRKMERKRPKLAKSFLKKQQARLGSVVINGELGGGTSMEWLPEKQSWGNAVGSFRVKVAGKVEESARIPQTLWLVKVKGGFKIAATVDIRIDRTTGLLEGTFDLRPLVSAYGEAMAGVPYVGVTGSAGGDIDYAARLSGPTLSTETFAGTVWGELYWRVFGWGNFKEKDKLRVWWSRDFLTGTSSHGHSGNIKGNHESSETASAPAPAVPTAVETESFFLSPAILATDGDMALTPENDGEVRGGVSSPVIDGNATLRAWLHDNTAREAANGPEVVFSADGTWNGIESVWDDGTADFTPALAAAADGTAVLAWTNAKRELAEDEAFEDVCRAMEIAVAVRDPATGEWLATNLTDDAALDLAPQVAVALDGTAVVAWLRNGAGMPFGSPDAPMQIWAARYAGGVWAAPAVVAADAGAALGFDLAHDGTVAEIVWACDADADTETSGDFAVSAATWCGGAWSAPVALASGLADAGSPVARLETGGTAFALWTEDGTLRERIADGADAASDARVLWDGDVSGTARPVRGADGALALVWVEPDEGHLSSHPVAMPRDPATGAWGGPVAAAREAGRQVSAVSGAFAADGSLSLAWESTAVSTNAAGEVAWGETELRTGEIPAAADPAVLAADFFFAVDPVPGEATSVVATVRNLGLGTATNVVPRLFVRDGAGAETELFGETGSAVSLDLPGGAAVVVTNFWTCDDSLADLTFAARLEIPAETTYASYPWSAQLAVAGYDAARPALTNFPVLVRIAENSPNGFSYAQMQGGADLCFVDMAGNGLPFEIDTWDPNGTSLVWVTLPAMAQGTQFFMCWGGGIPGKTVCADNPFAGYKGVWHMNQTNVADASGSGNDGTASGAVTLTNGVVGTGLSYPDTASFVSCGSSQAESELVGGYTVEGWVNLENLSGNKALFGKSGFLSYRMEGTAVRITTPGVLDYDTVNNFIAAANEWHHFALSFVPNKTGGAKHYVDGVLKGAQDTTGIYNQTGSIEMWLGRNQWASQGLTGLIDEYRLAPTLESADWIAATYATQSDPAFLTIGAATSYEVAPTPQVRVVVSDMDANAANNEAVWRPGAPDLWLENARSVAETADIRLLTATVRNFGLGPAPEGTVVSFRRGEPDGAEIGSDDIGAVLAGEANGYDSGIAWNMADVAFTSAWETVWAVIETGDADADATRAQPIRVMTGLDTDGDGLLDAEEEMIGTNPAIADTDGDGVSDYDEVYVRFTDPLRGPSDHTTTTPVPVPYAWLDGYNLGNGGEDAYEAAAKAMAANGKNKVWECYVAGLSPTNAAERFEARVDMVDGEPVVTWNPDLGAARDYVVEGKTNLVDRSWGPTNESTRFYRVKVELP